MRILWEQNNWNFRYLKSPDVPKKSRVTALLLLKLFNYPISSSFVIRVSSSSSYSQVINQNTKGFNTQKRAFLFGLTLTSKAPCFGKDATWEELLLFGQTITPTEQKHSLTHLWKLLHFYNCSICTALILHFIIYPNASGFYLLFKRDGWCISPTVTKGGFSPYSKFSANLIYLFFYWLTRLTDTILLNKEDSCTAWINAISFPRRKYSAMAAVSFPFFLFSSHLISIFIQSFYLRNKMREEHCYLQNLSNMLQEQKVWMGDRYAASPSKDHFVLADNIITTVLGVRYWSVIYFILWRTSD